MSFIILRANQKLANTHAYYNECLKDISSQLLIPQDKFELIVDAISGNPIEIFKLLDKKLIIYNVRDD